MTDFKDLIKVDHRRPPRILLYGGEGVGKTTQASKSKNPIFVQTEDGLGNLSVPAFPLCRSYSELTEYLEMLAHKEHDYSTVILDSVDWADMLIQRQVAEDHNVKEVAEISWGKSNKYCATYWEEIKELLTEIQNRGCTIILIGHSSITKIEDPLKGDHDKHSLKINRISAALIKEWVDIIIYAAYDMTIKKEDKGFGVKKNRAISDGSRIMYFSGTPVFDAKNRYGLPDQLPFDWAEFQKAFKEAVNINKGE